MHQKSSIWSLALCLLLLKTDNTLRAEGIDHNQGGEKAHTHMHMHSSSLAHMDHSTLVFFTPEDLKVGKTMPIYFRDVGSSGPHFLPKEDAELIPFSSSQLPYLLRRFGFSQDSPQGKAMEDTLRQCETPPIKGETKLCATSLESMLDFVHEILGTTTEIAGLSTEQKLIKSSTSTSVTLQNYTIVEAPKHEPAPKLVPCHTSPYPYAVFYCHYQESESRVYQVSLKGEDGSQVQAVAVCHFDTSNWSRNHVSFKVLGIEPGSSPVCHFFPADHLVWVPLDHGYHQERVAMI